MGYVEESQLQRAKASAAADLPGVVFSRGVDKTFRFVFVGSKDVRHIRNGFERSLMNYVDKTDEDGRKQIYAFLSVLPDTGSVNAQDSVQATCLPAEGRVVITFDSPGRTRSVTVEGSVLLVGLHRLFL